MISDLEALNIEVKNKQREYSQKKMAIDNLKEIIASIDNDSTVKVSEHAIIRYLERVKGINIEEVEKEILPDSVLKLIDTLGGNGIYPVDDFQIRLKNFTVTTIVKE